MGMTPPGLEFVLELRVTVGTAIQIGSTGASIKRFIPITGGVFSGSEFHGRVLPGGVDSQTVKPDSLTFLDARYAIEMDVGWTIEIHN
jgi:Protein of unknown function (DUF3237)